MSIISKYSRIRDGFLKIFLKRKLNLSINQSKVANNIIWGLMGKIVNLLSSLFVGILVARFLGPEKYGLMNYVISYVTLFSVLATFGMENIEIRELSKQKQTKDFFLGTAFRLRIILSIITIFIISITLFIYKSDLETTAYILIYSISIVANSFSVIKNYFTSIVLNKYIIKSEIIRTLFGILIKVFLLWIQAPFIWFIIILTIEFCVLSSGYIYSYKKHVGEINKWKYDKDIAKYILKESFPLLLSGAAVVIYQRIDQVLIGNMIDLESVGYFATANKFLDIILFLPVIITQSVTPLLIRIKERNIHEYNIKKEQFVSIVVWGTVLISTITFFCSEWLINITFGKNYLLAIPVLKILVWKTVGMALLITTGQLVIIEHIQKYAFIRNIIGLCVSVVLNLVFIPKYGIIGSAYVTLITIAFTSCLANVFIKPYHNMFKLQLRVIFLGWKEFFKIKSFLRSQNN